MKNVRRRGNSEIIGKFVCFFFSNFQDFLGAWIMLVGIIWSETERDPDRTHIRSHCARIREGRAEGGRGQPECFHGDWVSAIPLRGQRSLTRRSICHAASGGSQSREMPRKKEDQSEERLQTARAPQVS